MINCQISTYNGQHIQQITSLVGWIPVFEEKMGWKHERRIWPFRLWTQQWAGYSVYMSKYSPSSVLMRCLMIKMRTSLGVSNQHMTSAWLLDVLSCSDGLSALWWALRHLLWRATQRQRAIYSRPAKGTQAGVIINTCSPPLMLLCNCTSSHWWALWQPSQLFKGLVDPIFTDCVIIVIL